MSNQLFYSHPHSLVESKSIGSGTRIWAFAHILPEAVIGRDCNICDGVFIEGNVVVGDRVTINCGVQLWNGICIEDDVCIGPNATFSNDMYPRNVDKGVPECKTLICKGATIGANATILTGLTIGRKALIGAGAVVTRSVPPNAIVVGNPAQITGYTEAEQSKAHSAIIEAPDIPGIKKLKVRGVSLYRFKLVRDLRGNLTVGDFIAEDVEQAIPFVPKRYFLVMGVPSIEVRGEHAHYNCHQFLIAVNGSVSVMVDDGSIREEIRLDTSDIGVHVPPLTWCVQYKYSSNAVLLVFASHIYDPNDYIRDYDRFLQVIASLY
jgi:UDP-2-acetamido-3-amino-2,3-dideoxy-glucuronate N-acetyltransferase